ncbi:MAG: tRNA uridine-5-carboxymethylaminomethyl(34) synthesis GTPase MnmE [Ruminococcaceae bacterium]|nr:tRNA uridine-5-carboxymethylaminomethyl(34) synthesis GTPase MnmE [Oscillospiraceae bacterium]
MSTIAAISTGNAPGGIGVIRISGDNAVKIADSVFECSDKSSLAELGGYRAKYGHIVIDGEQQDDAVVLVFRSPRSYTGEDVAEISVHGGMLSVQKTLDAVLKAGAVPAGAGEFTKRAFINGKMDLTQAESVADIISAQGEAELRASYSALQGRLSKSINAVLEKLLDVSSTMAAWVDYPDEEIPELEQNELVKTLEFCKAELESLLSNYDKGQTIRTGVDTVIAGRPNVGKSSLMNMLTGTDKSIVTHIEGTTRDIVEENVRLGSIVLHLKDTAGLRESGDIVENIGIEKAYKAIEDAQLVLAVFDSSAGLTDEDRKLIDSCSGKLAVAVINKTDLENKADTAIIENAFDSVVYISAKNDEGLDRLEETVCGLLGVADFDSTAPLLANSRQKQHCENALASVCEALDGAALGITYDAINVMIDAAADELLSLTGKKANAEVVNSIFSKFCVGK